MVGLFAITSKVITSTEKNKLFQTFLQNGFEESRVSSFYFPALKVEVMEKVPFKIATRHRKSTYISHIVNNTATLAIRRRKLTDRLPAESTCFKWAHKTVWVYREEVRGEKFFPCWGLFIFYVLATAVHFTREHQSVLKWSFQRLKNNTWVYRPHKSVKKAELFENSLQTGATWNRQLCFKVWTKHILKTKLFKNAAVAIKMWFLYSSFLQNKKQECKSPCLITRCKLFPFETAG